MQIEIPEELFDRLQRRVAPGSTEADALREVLDAVDSLEEEDVEAESLAHSLATLDRGMEDVNAGRTMSVAEAKRLTMKELGLADL